MLLTGESSPNLLPHGHVFLSFTMNTMRFQLPAVLGSGHVAVWAALRCGCRHIQMVASFSLPAHWLLNKERLVRAWVGGSDLLSALPRACERPSETLGQVLWAA